MTSGKPLTDRDVANILRLLSYQTQDGAWLHSEAAIAKLLSMHPATVSEHVRQAAVAWGLHTRWRADRLDNPLD